MGALSSSSFTSRRSLSLTSSSLLLSFRSCNQAPMGRILSINRIPSCKFVSPRTSIPFRLRLRSRSRCESSSSQFSFPFPSTFLSFSLDSSKLTLVPSLHYSNMNTGQFVNAQKSLLQRSWSARSPPEGISSRLEDLRVLYLLFFVHSSSSQRDWNCLRSLARRYRADRLPRIYDGLEPSRFRLLQGSSSSTSLSPDDDVEASVGTFHHS